MKPLLWSLFLCCALVMAGTAQAKRDKDRSLYHTDYTDKYDEYFRKYAKRYFGPHFDWHWFKAQAVAESNLNPRARSHVGAVGLMQILPTTFGDISRANPYFGDINDPRWNIAAGIWYDRGLYRYKTWAHMRAEERLLVAFGGYNAGVGGMLRAMRRTGGTANTWNDMERFAPLETRGYVARIRDLMDVEKRYDRPSASRGIAAVYRRQAEERATRSP